MVVYVVSRNYLQYVFDEFMHLDTKMVGYGSLKRAHAGLVEVNALDLGGFIYVGDKIRAQKSFALFLQRADMVANKGTVFMIAVNDASGVEKILAATKLKNLVVMLYQYDVLTDFCIRRDIIAPVVMSKIQPYVLPKRRVVDQALREVSAFRLPEVFSERFMRSFSEPASVESLRMALEHDPVLADLDSKSFWYRLRVWFLYNSFGEPRALDLQRCEGEMTDMEYCSIKYILEGSGNV